MNPEQSLHAACADSLGTCKSGVIVNEYQKASLAGDFSSFFEGLFSTRQWPARWYCGEWSEFHGWLYIISDLLIWAAYFLIPVFLMRVALRRRDFPFPKTIWLFVAFIVLCGLTHLIDAIIFWIPVYRLSALVRFATAMVSVTTLFYLFRISPNITHIRTVSDLQKEIKERNVMEEKLAASEFLLNAAGEVGRLAGWEYDTATGAFNWTNTAGDIFESDQHLIKELPGLLAFFDEHDQVTIRLAFMNAEETGLAWDHELQMSAAGGAVKWVRFSGTPVLKDGEVVKIRGVLGDIDRYKTAEVNLTKSIDQMAQQNSQLKNFTHILSHNLRNHSSNIALLSTFVDEEKLDESNAEVFQRIKAVSSHLNSTLDDLSQIIRIRDNKMDNEELDMQAVTEKVLSVLSEAMKESNASVEMQFEEKTVNFPRIYLESVLMNLISNGLKYRKDGEPAHIKLKFYLNSEGMKELKYVDQGMGINLELHAEKVFGLYKTFHKHKDAHGVGLFLIKNQIEAQGGKIQIYSQENKGTTFKITFNEHA